ncbi:hypothetical protein Tco_0162131 [Tanacetum coccineum]
MSAKDKSGLGYGNQVHESVLSYENEVFQSVFDSRSSDVENSPVHDRFVNIKGMHAVPPPMTGNYMPSGPDREVDDSMFTYGPKQSKTSESDTQTSNFDSCESNSSVETLESVPEPVVVEPKVVSQPKVWSDAPIIEEYESDRKIVKEQNTYSPSPKADKRDWNGLMSKRLGLGYGFTKKACFVCGSFSHLIRDCDFHEKRMAKQVELNKKKVRVMVKGRLDINTARQNLSSQAATTSTARKVNIARPIVNEIRPRSIFYKSHSPIRRPFNRTTTPKANFSNQKVNTAEVKVVSAVRRKRETAVKPSAEVNIGRPKLSTARPKLSTDSTKIESMKLEAMVEERRIFKCRFYNHTTNGHQFTMSNRHQELASPEQTTSELASPKQTALGKGISNPLIVDSLLKTIWLSMHLVIAMKHWLFQSKRLLGRIVGFQKFLQLSAATYTSYYCQFSCVALVKRNTKDSRK